MGYWTTLTFNAIVFDGRADQILKEFRSSSEQAAKAIDEDGTGEISGDQETFNQFATEPLKNLSIKYAGIPIEIEGDGSAGDGDYWKQKWLNGRVSTIAGEMTYNSEEEARLKAAAPDLLAIAQRCLVYFSNEANYPEGTTGYQIAQDAKAAIEKATK